MADNRFRVGVLLVCIDKVCAVVKKSVETTINEMMLISRQEIGA